MNEGLIYLSTDFGASWFQTSAPVRYWESVASDGGGKRLAVVGSGQAGIWTYDDPTSFRPSVTPTVAPTRPTAQPTLRPTASPTTAPSTGAPRPNPTARPTGNPSARPTLVPTAAPTVGPTPTPSTAPPSADPSIIPSAAPSTYLTTPPTEHPSYAQDAPTPGPTTAPPSAAPTAPPSVLPTDSPTLAPTSKPSIRPTQLPTTTRTRAPSAVPTAAVNFFLAFQSNLTVAGASSSSLNSASQAALMAASAQTMDIPYSAVSYVRTEVLDITPADAAKTRSHSQKGSLAASYTLMAVLATNVNLADTRYTSVDHMYHGLTIALSEAVRSGEYDATLQSAVLDAGSTQLASATATDVTSSPAVVTTSPLTPDSSGDGDSSDTDMVLVIGLAVPLALIFLAIGCFLYYLCTWSKRYHRALTRKASHRLELQEGANPTLSRRTASFTGRLFSPSSWASAGFGALYGADEPDTGEVEFERNPVTAAASRQKDLIHQRRDGHDASLDKQQQQGAVVGEDGFFEQQAVWEMSDNSSDSDDEDQYQEVRF